MSGLQPHMDHAAKTLKALREAAALTRYELSMRLFCPVDYVERFEQGLISPSLRIRERLGAVLGVSPEAFCLGGSHD